MKISVKNNEKKKIMKGSDYVITFVLPYEAEALQAIFSGMQASLLHQNQWAISELLFVSVCLGAQLL